MPLFRPNDEISELTKIQSNARDIFRDLDKSFRSRDQAEHRVKVLLPKIAYIWEAFCKTRGLPGQKTTYRSYDIWSYEIAMQAWVRWEPEAPKIIFIVRVTTDDVVEIIQPSNWRRDMSFIYHGENADDLATVISEETGKTVLLIEPENPERVYMRTLLEVPISLT